MFASIGHLPSYLQMVYGVTATQSGLLLVALVVGVMVTGTLSANRISRSSRYRRIGTATSSNNFFREIGATLEIAVVGSLFSNRLTDRLADALAGSSRGVTSSSSLIPTLVHALPQPVRTGVITAYADSLTPIFGWLVPLFVVAALIALLIRETPLTASEPSAAH
jgi:hypothetical protein